MIGIVPIFGDVEFLVYCTDPDCDWEKRIVDPVAAHVLAREAANLHVREHHRRRQEAVKS